MKASFKLLYAEGSTEDHKGPYVIARRWQSKVLLSGASDVIIEYGDSQVEKYEHVDPATEDCTVIRRAIEIYEKTITGERVFDERIEKAETARKEREHTAPAPPPAPPVKTKNKEQAQAVETNQTPGDFLSFVLCACEKQKGKNGKPFFEFLKNQGTQAMIEQLNNWGINQYPTPNGVESTPLHRVEALVDEVLDLGASPEEVETALMRVCGLTEPREMSAEILPKAELVLNRLKAELEANVEALNGKSEVPF